MISRLDKLAISLVLEFESNNPDAVDLIGLSNDAKINALEFLHLN